MVIMVMVKVINITTLEKERGVRKRGGGDEERRGRKGEGKEKKLLLLPQGSCKMKEERLRTWLGVGLDSSLSQYLAVVRGERRVRERRKRGIVDEGVIFVVLGNGDH